MRNKMGEYHLFIMPLIKIDWLQLKNDIVGLSLGCFLFLANIQKTIPFRD